MSESALVCPDCIKKLVETRHGALALDECRHCRGCWYDNGEIRRAMERLGSSPQEPAETSRRRTLSMGVGMPCPRCHEEMARYTYADPVSITVDRCSKCGVWLRGGEFEKILAFAASDGDSALKSLFELVLQIPSPGAFE